MFHSRQAGVARELGSSLVDVAAFMHEVELRHGLLPKRRGIEKIRQLALKLQDTNELTKVCKSYMFVHGHHLSCRRSLIPPPIRPLPQLGVTTTSSNGERCEGGRNKGFVILACTICSRQECRHSLGALAFHWITP